MKSPVAYYLLLLYLSVMFKPLIPIVSDALSHTFNETIHIATVHAVYGSHHMAMAVASAASEDNNKHQTTVRFVEPVPLHIADEPAAFFFNLISIIAFFALFRIKKWTAVYLQMPAPPPKSFLYTSIALSTTVL